MSKDLAASVRARLLNIAKAEFSFSMGRITALFLVQLSGSHFEKEAFWQKCLGNIFNVLRRHTAREEMLSPAADHAGNLIDLGTRCFSS